MGQPIIKECPLTNSEGCKGRELAFKIQPRWISPISMKGVWYPLHWLKMCRHPTILLKNCKLRSETSSRIWFWTKRFWTSCSLMLMQTKLCSNLLKNWIIKTRSLATNCTKWPLRGIAFSKAPRWCKLSFLIFWNKLSNCPKAKTMKTKILKIRLRSLIACA